MGSKNANPLSQKTTCAAKVAQASATNSNLIIPQTNTATKLPGSGVFTVMHDGSAGLVTVMSETSSEFHL